MNIGRFRVMFLVVVAVAVGAGVSSAQRRSAGQGITVFDDINFQGVTVTLRSDIPDLREINLNDRISSVQVAPGEAWQICENNNYTGHCAVVNGFERDLRAQGWNDAISSIRRVQGRDARFDRGYRGGPGITVSDDVNFQGTTVTFLDDAVDLRQFNFNDRISSLQVGPGESWQICQNDNFGGRCVVVSGFVADMRSRGWNDQITSMRRVQNNAFNPPEGRGGFNPPQGRLEIVFFDQPGYRGMSMNLTDAAPGLGAFINRARSAQILNGQWEVCEEIRFGGRCVRMTGSVPDLGRIGLRGIASARPVGQSR